MEEQIENQTPSTSPGAAIGSFIVIAILIAGAVYTLGSQITKNKNTSVSTSTETIYSTTTATTTP